MRKKWQVKNLFRKGKLVVHKDQLVTVAHTDPLGNRYQAISVPSVLFPGLIHALHFKLSHPSKAQLTKLVARHFYTPGYQRIIEEVTNACETCAALSQLPQEMFTESTGDIDGFSSNFSADVIERNGQNILIVREKLSSFTLTKFIPDQKSETLKQALISLIIDMVPQSGSTVQVDFATAWATLARESQQEGSELKRCRIQIDMGRHHNKNKNPISDGACKEFHKEVLRLKPEGTALTEIERALITSTLNQRIRKNGLSSKEICFKRDLVYNTDRSINDQIIAKDIIEARVKKHNKSEKKNGSTFDIGHNVYLKSDKSKLRAREVYKVVDLFKRDDEFWAVVQKHNSQFRLKKYKIKEAELILLPGQSAQKGSQKLPDDENLLPLNSVDSYIKDISNRDSQPRNRRPERQAAIKAKKLLSNCFKVQKKE